MHIGLKSGIYIQPNNMLMMDDDDRVQDQLAGSNSKQQDDQRVASRHQNFHNKQNSKSRTKKICISVAKFVCSTFGLGIIVAGYSALGIHRQSVTFYL